MIYMMPYGDLLRRYMGLSISWIEILDMTIQVKYKHQLQIRLLHFIDEQCGFKSVGFEDEFEGADGLLFTWPFYYHYWKVIRKWKHGSDHDPLTWNKDDYPYTE